MTAADAPSVAPQAYAWWQERLSELFFAGRKGQPVVLFVDRDELQRLVPVGEDGVQSLTSAVRQIVQVDRGLEMFDSALWLERMWRTGPQDQPPPTLPVLALSVLAASEMRTDRSARRTAYYLRLVDALLANYDGDNRDESVRKQVLTVLRNGGAFLRVVRMWEHLNAWITHQEGAFGTSTIRAGIANESRIGYPLSQTLVRRSDRAALTRFFATLDLDSAGVPGPDSLMRMLRLWATRRGQGLTTRFVESLEDSDVLPLLIPLVHELASAWDGKVVTEEGLRRLDLRLTIDLEEGQAWWVIPSVRDLQEDTLRVISQGQDAEVLITADPHSSMYRNAGMPPVHAADVREGLVARGQRCVAEFQSARVLVLAENADASGWMTCDVVQPFAEHVILSHAEAAPAVNEALRTAADPGWRELAPSVTARMLGEGFSMFTRVVFSDQTKLGRALAAMPGVTAAGLRRGAAVRPRLVGGLPLNRRIGPNVYLAGGEPDLVLPLNTEKTSVNVSLDGVSSLLPATLFPVPLSNFDGGMHTGKHTVGVEGEILGFRVERASADDRQSPGVGSLDWSDGELRQSPIGTTDTGNAGGTANICGAVVQDAAIGGPHLARRGSIMTLLIGSDGQMHTIRDPQPPVGLPGLVFTFFEVPPSEAVWLAQQRATGWAVTLLRAHEPTFRGLIAAECDLWEELAASARCASPLWGLYARAWERYRAR